jgi:hypothetical protein
MEYNFTLDYFSEATWTESMSLWTIQAVGPLWTLDRRMAAMCIGSLAWRLTGPHYEGIRRKGEDRALSPLVAGAWDALERWMQWRQQAQERGHRQELVVDGEKRGG